MSHIAVVVPVSRRARSPAPIHVSDQLRKMINLYLAVPEMRRPMRTKAGMMLAVFGRSARAELMGVRSLTDW